MKRVEDKLQENCARFLNSIERYHGGFIWFHVPNEGKRTKAYGAKLKRMGMRAGVPDIVMVFKKGKTVFVELKTAKGKLSKGQNQFKKDCKKNKISYIVSKSDNVADHLNLLEKLIKKHT